MLYNEGFVRYSGTLAVFLGSFLGFGSSCGQF